MVGIADDIDMTAKSDKFSFDCLLNVLSNKHSREKDVSDNRHSTNTTVAPSLSRIPSGGCTAH